MGKFIKFFLFFVGGLVVLGLAGLVIVPKMIDVQKYKPLIVEKVAAATGRPVSLGGDLNVSIFPWVGVSFTDFRLGNPDGFSGKDFIVVKSFEAHVKVMPLLSREVQIDSFVVDGPEIYLEKRKDGQANWQGLGTTTDKESKKEKGAAEAESGRFGLKSIEVGEFSIINGRVYWADRQQGLEKEVSDLNLQLTDLSLERPVMLNFSAVVDDKAVGVRGKIGPFGPKPGEGVLPLDLTITAVEQLTSQLKGQLENLAGDLSYTLALDVSQFSPRKLLHALNIDFPIVTSDPAALDVMALSMGITGGAKNVAFSDGKLMIDNSKLEFNGNAKAFTPLDLAFDGNLDTIDLDRYMTPKKEQDGKAIPIGSSTGQGKAPETDYTPLRKLNLDSQLRIGKLKVQGGKVENVIMHLTADKGIFKLSPFSLEMYEGNVTSVATVNVQAKKPVTSIQLKTANVQVGPLLRDFAKKDVLEGALAADLALTMNGDNPEIIKKSLNGKGELIFTDGAIVGIDLAGMIRNAKASFGLADRTTEKPRTDFAELRSPFTLTNGLVNTPETSLQSPLIRVTVSGDANLVTEALDMKVQPKFVATLKGQGDTAERKGLMVPVLVGGTFTSPEFSPDLTALLQGQIPDVESVKKAIEQEINLKDQGGALEEGIKSLIPQFR